MMVAWLVVSCGDGQGTERLVIDQIEILAYDVNYAEDPFGESGAPDFFAVVSVWNEEYYTSPVVTDQGIGARIDFESLSFQGIEIDREVTITLFDHDDDSLEDFVGEVTFVPRDLIYTEPVRHSLYGGYLQVDLLLQW
ncbi:MAG: C2 domain-containing protein [Bacteroidetes bacterium]|nr:C2 domain-containing protein [Bacteroidota bacterium]MDA1241912.1 C2 domain-containing protein [Bacteroidota bacterium]